MKDRPNDLDAALPTLEWVGDAATGTLRLIDQTLLPGKLEWIDCRDLSSLWEAIRSLRVRGAPAIGVAAAYGCVIGARAGTDLPASLAEAAEFLRTSRPTAVNLFWAIDRMRDASQRLSPENSSSLLEQLLTEAHRIHQEDRAMCRAIGTHGSPLIHEGDGVLTHCNLQSA